MKGPKIDVSEDFDSDFKDLQLKLTKLEKTAILLLNSSLTKQKVSEFDELFRDSEGIYFHLENEFIGIPKSIKGKYQEEMSRFNLRIKKLKQQYDEIESNYEALLQKDNPKEALLDVNKKLQKTNNIAADSIKVLRTTNDRDNQTMVMLSSQTEKIIQNKETLNSVEVIVNRSEVIVRGLLNRVTANKLLLLTIIFLLSLSIIIVIYFKLKRLYS